MPNWKKVIVSGSNAVLNQITASGAIVSTNANSNLSGSFSGSFQGDGTNLNLAGNTTISTTPFPFAGDGIISGSLLISSSNVGGVSTASLSLQGSGSTIFTIQGSQGNLFSVTDDLLHDNLVVNDISGDTLFKVSGSGLVTIPVGDLSGSGAATASYGHFIGDGNGLINLNFAGSGVLSGSIADQLPSGIISSSAQIASNISGAFVAPSASFSTRVSAVELITDKTLLSGSAQIASNISGAFVAPSASFSTRVSAVELITDKTLLSGSAQIASNISGSWQGQGFISASQVFPYTASSAAIISRSIASGDTDSTALRLFGSGSISESGIFEVEGSAGPLFSVADGLDGVLMEVNNISGLPLFQVSSSNEVFINRGNLTSGVTTATASFAMFSGSFQGNASQLTNISAGSITGNITTADTASYVLSSSIDGITDYIRVDQTSSMTVATASYVISSSIDGITDYVRIDQTSSMTVATASYVGVGTTSGLVPFTTANGKLTAETGFEYNTTTNQLKVFSLDVIHLTSSFITSSRIHTSGSNIFGDDTTDTQTLIGTTIMSGSAQITGSLTGTPGTTNELTASYAITASHALSSLTATTATTSTTASFALTSSLVIQQDATNKVVGTRNINFTGNAVALTTGAPNPGASVIVAINTGSAAEAFPFTGDAQITGSLIVVSSATATTPTTQSLKIDSSGNFYHLGYYDGGNAAFANNSTNTIIGNDIADDGDYYNTIIGYQAGVTNPGHANVIIGVQTVTNGNIDHSVAIGATAQTNNDGDISIGSDAGDTANSKGINIGRYAHGEGVKGIVLNTAGVAVSPTKAHTFGVYTHGTQPVLEIEATGSSLLTGSSFTIEKSGSTVFEVIGSEGTLFSVDDDLDGTIFTANDRSGLPVLEASASGEVYIGKAPQSLYTTAVISSTTANISQSIYGLSTSSYGGVFVDYTANSGSNARAGSIVSVWNGSSINFTETTTLDIGDTSNLLMQVAISQSQAQVQSYATTAGYNIKTIIRSI